MDAQRPTEDPRLRALNTRLQAAMTSLDAAKVYCKVTHFEAVAANLMVARIRHQELAAAATVRGQHFFDKMKECEAALARQGGRSETLQAEMIRNRQKAMKMSADASAHEKKMADIEERMRTVLAEAEMLRHERDKRLIEVRKLEAEAIRVESLI